MSVAAAWLQTDLPLLTELDEDAIKAFTREFEVRAFFELPALPCAICCRAPGLMVHMVTKQTRGCRLLQIDYINLTYTCSGLDVHEMRDFLDNIGATQVKIIAKVSFASPHVPVSCVALFALHHGCFMT